MTPFSFAKGGIGYEVRFSKIDDQWFATLHVSGSEQSWELLPVPYGLDRVLSDDAIRSGYIALADWLVEAVRPKRVKRPTIQSSGPDQKAA